jgi:hypothetical protein
LYILLLELDRYYSKPVDGLDEGIRTKLHQVFMMRWSVFHGPSHSLLCFWNGPTIKFCHRDMDDGVKKDFSKTPGGKDLSKMKSPYDMFVESE